MRTVWLLVAALLLTSCNSVSKEPLPESANDPRLAEIGKKLDEDEKKLLIGYLARREMAKAFGGGGLADEATTVGEALEAQRKWVEDLTESERKAAELKAEVDQKRKAVAEQISKAVTVAFLDADFLPSDYMSGSYEDYENFTFAVQNTGGKAVKAIKGEAVFIDTFGDEFVRVPMQMEQDIGPGEKKVVELGMEINKFMDEHKRIMQLDSSKKFRFEPDQIVFHDGTTVKAPEQVD